MSWYECASGTVGKVVNSDGLLYICSNENGILSWKELFNVKLLMIILAFLFFLPVVLKKLGIAKIRQKRKR